MKEQDRRAVEGMARCGISLEGLLEAFPKFDVEDIIAVYDEVAMPVELRKAHQANDRAVMKAYGFPIKDFTEEDCVAELMKMYQKLVGK